MPPIFYIDDYKFSNSLQELRRDWQAKISARTNINIAQIEDYGGETFLSEEVASKLLRIARNALQRCSVVSILCFSFVFVSKNP